MVNLVSQLQEKRTSGKPPILLVPGAFCGDWLWRDTFMPFFYDRGYDVYAMSFSHHGGNLLTVNRFSLKQFQEELSGVISRLPAPPAVMAHSLGGLVTLQVIAKQVLPCVALLSSIPPDGIARSLLALGRRSPVSVLKLLGLAVTPVVSHFIKPPVGMYSNTCDPDALDALIRQLKSESLLALTQALRPDRLPLVAVRRTPIHCFGAEGDYVVPAGEVRRTAGLLGVPVKIYPGMSHAYTAESSWADVAEDICTWFESVKEGEG